MSKAKKSLIDRLLQNNKSSRLFSSNLINYSLQKKIQLLGIDKQRESEIQQFKYVENDYEHDQSQPKYFEIISISSLVGLNGMKEAKNWMNLLQNLHKNVNFIHIEKNGLESFKKYMEQLNKDSPDLPEVIHVNGEYLINGNGKHRLTIAKCIGIEKIPVLVLTSKAVLP